MRNLLQNLTVLVVLSTIIAGITLYAGQVFAGGADEFHCTRIEKPKCKARVIYKTKVIERPVQQIVERTKTIKVPVVKYRTRTVVKTVVKKVLYTHKNRLSLFVGQSYDNDAKLNAKYRLVGPYNSTLVPHNTLADQKKKNNIGVQYMRDLYIRPNFSVHGLIQYQSVSGPSVGFGIGW